MNIFKHYSSIENHYNQKHLQDINLYGNDFEWVATEKVHGSNFSATTDGNTIKWGKRSSYIPEYALSQFSNSDLITGKYHESIIRLHSIIQSRHDSNVDITVFGELCGGEYFDELSTHRRVKPVQKNVYYSPNIEFIAFDIALRGEHDMFLPIEEVISLCAQVQIPSVQILFRGSLNEMLNLSPEFVSTVPQIFGYEPREENTAEGFVIRPTTNQCRLLTKIKSQKFKEITECKKGAFKQVKVSELTDEQKTFVDEISNYLTESRLESVLSKLDDKSKNNQKRVLGLLIQDALQEYVSLTNPDHESFLKLKKETMNNLQALSFVIVSQYNDETSKDKDQS